jgi:hypothetical protein
VNLIVIRLVLMCFLFGISIEIAHIHFFLNAAFLFVQVISRKGSVYLRVLHLVRLNYRSYLEIALQQRYAALRLVLMVSIMESVKLLVLHMVRLLC